MTEELLKQFDLVHLVLLIRLFLSLGDKSFADVINVAKINRMSREQLNKLALLLINPPKYDERMSIIWCEGNINVTKPINMIKLIRFMGGADEPNEGYERGSLRVGLKDSKDFVEGIGFLILPYHAADMIRMMVNDFADIANHPVQLIEMPAQPPF